MQGGLRLVGRRPRRRGAAAVPHSSPPHPLCPPLPAPHGIVSLAALTLFGDYADYSNLNTDRTMSPEVYSFAFRA